MKATLEHSEACTRDTYTFWFRPAGKFSYIAGQFIELSLPHADGDSRDFRRWFTLSSSPTEPLLAITTRLREPMSPFKQALAALQPGDTVTISEPMGDFVLPKDPSVPIVFVAGGIGITPVRSMVKFLHDNQAHRTMHLIYGATTVDDLAFRDIFADYGLPTDIFLTDPPRRWDGQTGRLTADAILEHAPNVDNKFYYLSGPEILVEELVDQMKQADIPSSRLVTDYFQGYTDV